MNVHLTILYQLILEGGETTLGAGTVVAQIQILILSFCDRPLQALYTIYDLFEVQMLEYGVNLR